ncbi:MAG: PKD domain-containing protein [Bacteroidota bacterium]
MKPFHFILGCLLFLNFSLFAQSWQWGIHGGSISTLSFNPREEVVDMSTDPHGNVYFTSDLQSFPRFIGGVRADSFTSINSYGSGSVLVSYDCQGNFRWSKSVAVAAGSIARGRAVATDDQGGVYWAVALAMITPDNQASIDVDTTVFEAHKRHALIKYDTSGTYQWIRLPETDTISSPPSGRIRISTLTNLSVSPDGEVYWYCQLTPGLLSDNSGIAISSAGTYVLRYDPLGNLLRATELAIDNFGANGLWETEIPRYFARDHVSGRFYVCDQYLRSQPSPSLGSQQIVGSNYVGAFDSTGQFLWARQNDPSANAFGFKGNPQIDQKGNVYLVGGFSHLDTFNNHQFINFVEPSIDLLPAVVVLDSTGNNVWINSAGVDANTFNGSIALYEPKHGTAEVVVGGSFPSLMIWAGDTLSSPSNYGYDPFLARFDAATGTGIGMTRLPGTFGAGDFATGLTADTRGNFYFGGRMDGSGELFVSSDTLNGYGGNFDFFMAKYGSNDCALCTNPVADASTNYDSTSLTVPFLFTGVTNYDSLIWTFGDGNSSTAVNPQHGYAQAGTYTACVQVFNACGSDSLCLTLTVCTPPVASFTAQDSFLQVAFNGAASTSYDSLFWTFGDGNSSMSVSPTHTYAQAGSYEVCLRALGLCGSDSLCDTVIVTQSQSVGISTAFSSIRLRIYPNPSASRVNIAYVLPVPVGSLVLYDTQGRTIRQKMLTNPQGTWQPDISTLSEGLYLVLLWQGNQLVSQQKLAILR